MNLAAFKPADVVVLTCLGGVGFFDPVRNVPVAGPLQVTARRRGRSTLLPRTAGGWHALHAWPGMDATSQPVAFEVDVVDPAGLFLPLRLQLNWPAWSDLEHPATVPACDGLVAGQRVPLFSAPSRGQPAGWQTIRGQLAVRQGGAPACWALVRVYRQADPAGAPPLARALADAAGRFCLMFPLPRPDEMQLPPVPERFGVVLQVEFDDTNDAHSLPDYCQVTGQRACTLIASQGATAADDVPLGALALEPGAELVLRTLGADGQPLSELQLHAN